MKKILIAFGLILVFCLQGFAGNPLDTIPSRTTLKTWFSKGKKPTESQFHQWIDAFYHLDEDTTGIDEVPGLADSLAAIRAVAESGGTPGLADSITAHRTDLNNLQAELDGVVDTLYKLNDTMMVVVYGGGTQDTLDVGGGVGGGGSTAVDTLYSYADIRDYTGDANAIYLNGTGVAGLFRRVATGTENGGTLIAASNGVKWQRDFDPGVGYNIEWFGAVGDSITDDQPAIQDCIQAAHDGAKIYGDYSKIYLIKNEVNSLYGNRSYENIYFKRAAATKTNLKSAAASGATFITVNSTTDFVVGGDLWILDTTSVYLGKGATENSRGLTISGISNDTIYLSDPVVLPTNGNLTGAGAYPVGSKVIKYYEMMKCGASRTDLISCTFDGNRAQNAHTYDWAGPVGVSRPGQNSVITRCIFKNMPCEAMFVEDGPIVTNNVFKNCNGSGVHISNSSPEWQAVISNNVFRDMSEIAQEIASHNEACIVFSASPNRTIITENNVIRSGNGFVGAISGIRARDVVISNNIVHDTRWFFAGYGNSAAPDPFFWNMTITGNQGTNVGAIDIQAATFIHDSLGADRIIISDNIFTDFKIMLANVSNATISNNLIKYTGYPDTAGYNTNLKTQTSLIRLSNCVNVSVTNNKLENFLKDYDEVERAIQFATAQGAGGGRLKTDSLTFSSFSGTSRFLNISGNSILGFPIAITDSNTDSTGYQTAHVGVDVMNNFIMMSDSAEARYAIRCTPGMRVWNNDIYGNSFSEYGLQIIGVHNSLSSLADGPSVLGNSVSGIPVSAVVGPAGVANNTRNCIVENNYFSGTITDNSAGNSSVRWNKVIRNKAIPLQMIRENHTWY